MSSDWAIVRLGDTVDFITGFPFASKYYTDDNSAPYLIRGDNVIQGTLRLEGVKRWPISDSADYDAYWLCENDVLLAMDRPWIEAGLKFAPVRSTDLPALLVQRVARLRGTDMMDSRFLKHLIATQSFTNYVLSIQTGTAVPHISGNQIKNYKFALPPLPEQRDIAATLSALDDKIEINNRINKTLEEIAQALFKRWFVDFEFPDENGQPYKSTGGEMEASELGPIPKGWRVKQLDEVVTLSNKTINPQNFSSSLFEHFSIPSFDDKKTPVLEIGQNIKSNKFVINSANILVSKLNPSTKRIWKPLCSTSNAVCSTEFMVYKAINEEHTDFYYSLMDSAEFQNYLLAHVTGSTNSRQRVTPSSTLQFKYIAPPDPLLEMYAEIAKPIFAKVQINTVKNCRIMKARDTLLPKLMSGEIRVPIEAVAADV